MPSTSSSSSSGPDLGLTPIWPLPRLSHVRNADKITHMVPPYDSANQFNLTYSATNYIIRSPSITYFSTELKKQLLSNERFELWDKCKN